MDGSYNARNRAGRERLRAIIDRLSEDDYALPLGNGWTVSAALMHLAFWDRHCVEGLENWERGIHPTRGMANAINDARLPEWLAATRGDAAESAVAAAEAVDQKISTLDSQIAQEVLAAGYPRYLDRSLHRHEHLDEIERLLT